MSRREGEHEYAPAGRPRPPRPPRPGRRRRRVVGLLRLAALLAVIGVAVALLGRGGVSPGQQVAERFTRAWADGAWAAMYEDVDPITRLRVPLDQFEADYANAAATATITGVSVGTPVLEPGDVELVRVRIRTRIFGTLHERFELYLTGTGSATRVLWNDALTFPGLRPGEELTRVTNTPARGQLLARDGVPLDEVAAAADIIGSVGPPTPRPGQRTRCRRLSRRRRGRRGRPASTVPEPARRQAGRPAATPAVACSPARRPCPAPT